MKTVTVDGTTYFVDEDIVNSIESICNQKVNNIFSRHPYGTHYCYISEDGTVGDTIETGSKIDEAYFNAANYCIDYMVMYDRMLFEVLTRRLWRWGASRDCLIDPKADSGIRCWEIDWSEQGPYVALHIGRTPGAIYFKTQEMAEEALTEVVKPFIANNPEFCW